MSLKINPVLNKFNIQAFNDLIKNQGIELVLHKVTNCPNRKDLYQESHDIECDFCDNGVVSYQKIPFKGVIQATGLDKYFKAEGHWLTGSARLTAPSDIQFDYFDVIEVPNANSRYNELVVKGNTAFDALKYKPNKIVYVADSDKVIYKSEADFTIAKNGKIKWLNNNKPAAGKIFTVSYEYAPRFRVLEHFHFMRDTTDDAEVQTQAPRQVLIRIDYLYDDKETAN